MAFKTENKNAFRKIVHLSTAIQAAEADDSHTVSVHLGIYREEIELEDAVVDVGLKTAFLSVETEGLEIDPASKYGEVGVPAVTSTDHTVTETLQRTVEESAALDATIQGSLSPIKLDAEASLKGSVSGKRTAAYSLANTHVETKSFQNVEAIGDDRWRILSEKGTLHGKYLHGQTLCATTVSNGRANRRGLAVSVHVRKRDLEVKLVTDKRSLKFMTVNRERMIALLLAKSLSKSASAKETESILLATSESFDED